MARSIRRPARISLDGDRPHPVSDATRVALRSASACFLAVAKPFRNGPIAASRRVIQEAVHPLFAESLDGMLDEAAVIPLPFTASQPLARTRAANRNASHRRVWMISSSPSQGLSAIGFCSTISYSRVRNVSSPASA